MFAEGSFVALPLLSGHKEAHSETAKAIPVIDNHHHPAF